MNIYTGSCEYFLTYNGWVKSQGNMLSIIERPHDTLMAWKVSNSNTPYCTWKSINLSPHLLNTLLRDFPPPAELNTVIHPFTDSEKVFAENE